VAGVLTYPHLKRLPVNYSGAIVLSFKGLTAAGTISDFHTIPY